MPSVVQRAFAVTTGPAFSVELASPPTAGNLLLCGIGARSSTEWTPGASWTLLELSGTQTPAIVYGKIAGAGESAAVGLTAGGNAAGAEVVEISPSDGAWDSVDQAIRAHASNSTEGVAVTDLTTPALDADPGYLYAVFATEGQIGINSVAPPFTREAAQAARCLTTADYSPAEAGSYSTTLEWTNERPASSVLVAVADPEPDSGLSIFDGTHWKSADLHLLTEEGWEGVVVGTI